MRLELGFRADGPLFLATMRQPPATLERAMILLERRFPGAQFAAATDWVDDLGR